MMQPDKLVRWRRDGDFLWFVDYSPDDILPGVASFDQFSEIAFNNADKARVTTPVESKCGYYGIYKNSSGDEIVNVNFYAVRPGSYPNSLK